MKMMHKTLIASLLISSTLSTQSFAIITPAIQSAKNTALVSAEQATKDLESEGKTDECSDETNEHSLAGIQKKAIEKDNALTNSTVAVDKLYDIGKKGGCFVSLADFPDLSVNIPSLSSIFDSVRNTLVKYATRKVCNAVNEAINEITAPINQTIGKLNDSGQLDLTGRVNKEIQKKLFEFDPEAARVQSKAESGQEVELTW